MTRTRIDRIALAVTAILGLGLAQTAMAETELDVVVTRFVATGMARSNDHYRLGTREGPRGHIGCGVGAGGILRCDARDHEGNSLTCESSDPRFVSMKSALAEPTFLQFETGPAGDCASLTVLSSLVANPDLASRN